PRATLLTRVEPKGRLVHRFAFEVRGWSQPTLPLRLPAGARLAAVYVDGREVTSLPFDPASNDPVVVLPVPASAVSGRSRSRVARQEEAVRVADARLRREGAGREATLAEALSDLAFEGLAAQDERLVLDAAALEDAGLHPGITFRLGQAARVGETEGPALASL